MLEINAFQRANWLVFNYVETRGTVANSLALSASPPPSFPPLPGIPRRCFDGDVTSVAGSLRRNPCWKIKRLNINSLEVLKADSLFDSHCRDGMKCLWWGQWTSAPSIADKTKKKNSKKAEEGRGEEVEKKWELIDEDNYYTNLISGKNPIVFTI